MGSRIRTTLLVIFGVSATAFGGWIDYRADKEHMDTYCMMRGIWNDHEHIPITRRPGWPDLGRHEECRK